MPLPCAMDREHTDLFTLDVGRPGVCPWYAHKFTGCVITVFLVIRQSFNEAGIYNSYSEIIFISLISCLGFTWTCVVIKSLSMFVRCDCE